jgi:hypothetical protein
MLIHIGERMRTSPSIKRIQEARPSQAAHSKNQFRFVLILLILLDFYHHKLLFRRRWKRIGRP